MFDEIFEWLESLIGNSKPVEVASSNINPPVCREDDEAELEPMWESDEVD